ncbi:hypothetical protein [Lacisediminihabitans changchengi]|uniref:Uncharacterized protein n=1 Tax=Lacisediminihabitans changchengi TaxID=2787634 RepID=A0A934SL60_9MICO|nr:hypothetical protein [Lacisediminihabitans changchengi]MBK4346932.1 hypothetical protein [Lacisediminihabitans changchengi]MBK4347945.1 hypothetical protein [Lacisediminihabitans changchengi]
MSDTDGTQPSEQNPSPQIQADIADLEARGSLRLPDPPDDEPLTDDDELTDDGATSTGDSEFDHSDPSSEPDLESGDSGGFVDPR